MTKISLTKLALICAVSALLFSLVFDTSSGVREMWLEGGSFALVCFALSLVAVTWVVGAEDFFSGRDRPQHLPWASLSVVMLSYFFLLTKAHVTGHRPELFFLLGIACCALAMNEASAQHVLQEE